ncbi:hypothetical protein [Paenibacillus donghaensis]|uniref:Uncharacterized protein n=1 Tax=Paenibacillus donghaensis TaxID=414771 RepID=A0A2Z2KGR1_9BACL|nr:hypothetical protein [Paenibacillus donghaensis]ASA25394.1 hypothetical protein B9T62_34470 [Paenibacillus donghaensis]
MNNEDWIGEAKFIASNAKQNLIMINNQASLIDPVKLSRNIKWLEMMIDLNNHELAFAKEQQKKARLAGRTSLRSRLKSLLSSILTVDQQKRKGETV